MLSRLQAARAPFNTIFTSWYNTFTYISIDKYTYFESIYFQDVFMYFTLRQCKNFISGRGQNSYFWECLCQVISQKLPLKVTYPQQRCVLLLVVRLLIAKCDGRTSAATLSSVLSSADNPETNAYISLYSYTDSYLVIAVLAYICIYIYIYMSIAISEAVSVAVQRYF